MAGMTQGRRHKGAARGLAVALLLVAPGLRAADPAPLALSAAWVRALPPGRTVTAAYLQAFNPGPAAVRITGARAVDVPVVELHTTRMVDGLHRMEPVAEQWVPAGGTVELAPRGLHLMLRELARTPAPGERLTLCLITDAGEACTEAEVRSDPPVAVAPGHRH